MASELLQVRADLNAGRDALASLDLGTVDEAGGIAAVVDRAAGRIEDADNRARTSPVLGLLARVPVVRGQVAALRDLTGAAADIAARGRETAGRLQAVIDQPPGAANRLELARTAATELQGLSTYVAEFELGADGWLLPPLAWAREDLDVKLIEARGSLRRASAASDALAQLLTGPRRYLIAAGNNAEMRSVGVVTATGVANIANGEVDVGQFVPNDQSVISPVAVPVPEEWRAVYGWRGGARRYPGTTYTPNWPVAAQIIAEISARNVHGPVDGVLYVDTLTLAAVLEVVGPVTVEGMTYDATNVVSQILYENYLRWGTVEDNLERKELQGAIAEAAFTAIEERDYSVLSLAGALAELASSRHLLGWAADPAEQDLWETLGVDGHLEADDIMVEVANLGSSKLDYFVTTGVAVTTELDEDAGVRRAQMAVTITNRERPRTTEYIEGFAPPDQPGAHVAWVGFYVPQYATGIEPVDFPGFTQAGPDGPLYVAGTVVVVPRGEARTYTISFVLPPDQYQLTVLPAARVSPTWWSFDGSDAIPDRNAFRYDLETGEITPDDRTLG